MVDLRGEEKGGGWYYSVVHCNTAPLWFCDTQRKLTDTHLLENSE